MRKVITPLMLNEGFEIPFGYGFAYMSWLGYNAVYYVIPVNWIMRCARAIYFFFARGEREKEFDLAVQMGSDRGWARGYDAGFKEGFRQRWEGFAKEAIRLLDEEGVSGIFSDNQA